MKKRMQTFLTLTVVLLMSLAGVMTAGAAPRQQAGNIVINEVDADQVSTDNAEFVELFDGGSGNTDLTGLVLVFYNGNGDVSYNAFDLDGFTTDAEGYFVVCGNEATVANCDLDVSPDTNLIQNGADAVALYVGDATDFPNGTPVTTTNLIDAIVYDTDDSDDAGLLVLLSAGQPQVNERGGGDGTGHSNQRCPNGSGGALNTDTYAQFSPTPGVANLCTTPPPPPPPAFTIMEIQGDGQFSSFDGQVVETTGVVTLYTANGANFWLQDPDGDDDFSTSDGIFISGGGYPDEGPRPEIGDFIRIIAQVQEQQYGNALPLTRLRNVALIEVLSSGNEIPAPVELDDLPDESIADGIAFWEPLEGMLVSVQNAPVVAATSGYGEFAVLAKDDAKPGSGFYPETQQILIRNLGGEVVDYNPERILVDDSTLEDPINVMPGDRVRSLVGVVDYTFGNYKLQPASYDVKTHNLPKLPASDRSGGNGNLAITTFNVENLFDLDLNIPVVVDVIGQVGFDPGSQWGTDPTSTKDNTILRMASVCLGDTNGTDAFDPSLEWDGFPKDNIDGLGTHTPSCEVVDGLFISEYVEGGYYNKVIEIYNGTGDAVNLAAQGYAVDIYFNGSSSLGRTISLAGTLEDGDVFVLAHTSADATILDVADQTSGSVLFNGDDAVALRKGGKDDAGSTTTPEELDIQLTKLALAIEVELELPEIIVVQEVENTEILQVLGDRVNAAAGTNYMAVSFETSDVRGIEVGFLWDAGRGVTLLDAFQMSGTLVEEWFGPSSPSPGREPIVGTFDVEGEIITIVGNHFKSKGGDDPLFGMNWPPIRITEVQRKMQAQVVRDFVNTILGADPNALVMVTGDLNDFQFGEPGEGTDHPIAILEGIGGGVPLTNLINLEKDDERWTYVYDGNSQVLDHMLVSPALFDLLVGTDVLHFNAGFPSDLGSDPSTPLRSSDHDALEGRFKIK